MYYFDSEFIGQYLDQGTAVRIFVDGEFYDIADRGDINDQVFGVGYDLNGKPHTFDYRAIEQIKAGGHTITIDQLQDKIGGSADDAEAESPEMDMEPDGGGEEAPSDSGEGDTGGDIGDMVPDPDTGGGEEAPEDEAEPPRESIYYQTMVMDMLNEAKKKDKVVTHNGITIGDLVQNIDKTCEYHGSRGSVTNIVLPEDGGAVTMIEYRVHNIGYNFKPNQKVIKPLSQLQKMGNDE